MKISAEIKTYSYPAGNTNDLASVRHGTIHCVCTVGPNLWAIENDFSKNSEVKWFFDGTNVFNSRRITKPASSEATAIVSPKAPTMQSNDVRSSNLTIDIDLAPGGCPLGDMGVNIPWLAFCSGQYLRREGRIIPLPVSRIRNTPDAFAYTDITQVFEDKFGLPRTVDLVTSESLYERAVTRYNLENFVDANIATSPKPKWKSGILKFHYAVIESTNFFGRTLPITFEFFQNDIRDNGDVVLRYSGVGKVSNIQNTTEPEGLFETNQLQTIVDWRLRNDSKQVSGQFILLQILAHCLQIRRNSKLYLQSEFNNCLGDLLQPRSLPGG